MARDLTLADGQLSSTAATLFAGSGTQARRVDVILQNTGSSTETVTLTFTRANGSTARRLARLELGENQQAFVYGVPLEPDDTLTAVATTGSVVDYLVFASGSRSFGMELLDSTGTSKAAEALRKTKAGVESLVGDELPDLG
jgi:hypothetical protein